MDLVLKSIKPADYPFLLEMAKRLGAVKPIPKK